MGEENLVLKPGPHGYKLDLDKVATDDNVVTVGKIWTHADVETDHPLFRSNPRIRSQCLSFAPFKLLRRTVEHLPAMSKEETELIFQGICSGGVSKPQDSGEALFQVLKDEIGFLSEYYHSIHPVVFASPYFFLVNYLLFPAVVCCLCLLTILLCGNGDMPDAYRSILTENYAISTGVFTLTKCPWRNFLLTPGVFFSTIDISITYLLFLAFIYEVLWEFLVFVFSNWFMVSLLCTYTAKPHMFQSPTYSGALHRISWANRMLGRPSLIAMKQFSVLGKALLGDGKGDWELLATLWVELVAYIAPSSGDDHLKGQKEALVQGGELVTMLWALATHTGITRPPPSEVAVTHVEDIEEGLRSSAA